MDESTHDLVIRRLEIAIESMSNSDAELPGVQTRLADLYADRARLKALNELAGHCKDDCKASRHDRRRAINLYNAALPKIEKSQQGRVILQIAHLYNLNDQSPRSIELYKKIISARSGVYASEVRGLALASLGEIQFKKGQFATALGYYDRARKENIVNRGFVEYRLAWCQLNIGHIDQAIKTLTRLLSDPNLLATQSTEGKSVDQSFVQDVSSDLARFLARGSVDQQQIELLKSLSPEATRKENLKTLADETDRLGKKQASLAVWQAYAAEGQIKPVEKIEVQSRVAQIYYDLNRQSEASSAYQTALDLWKKNGCSDAEVCEELKTRLRRFVTTWDKAQGKKPTEPLFNAYIAYSDVFADAQMLHWGAQVGAILKKYPAAGQLFHRAAEQARAQNLKTIFEGSLLGEIEMAEASKDKKSQENAYNYYLAVNPNGPQATQVRYQRAQLFYSTSRIRDAFNEFNYLANMKAAKDNQDIRVKSADLALDSLVALKDDQALQMRGLEYARLFPERRTEYLKISRNATMNIVANNLKSSRADFKANLATLNQVNLDGADDQEKIKYYRNKLIIAQKALDLGAVEQSANALLKIKSLNASDKEWALSQKVWVAELELNFDKSYSITKTMTLPNLSKADRELRLALLADLAGRNSRPHNQAFLNLSKNLRAGNLVRITLIKTSSSPWSELDRHISQLRRTPDLFSGIVLETFARSPNFGRAERLLKTTGIGKFPAGATLARHLDLKEINRFDRKIAAHRIYGYSDKAMTKTLRERMRLIGENESWVQKSLKRKDWTLQIIALNILARENRRLHQDIMNLPVPSKLDAEQKKEYLTLLKAKSDPYLARATSLQSQIEDMWRTSNSVQNLQSAFMTASPDLQKLYRSEITSLAAIAPSGAQKRLQNLLNTPYRRPSQKDILLARRDLQNNPFDIGKVKALRDLEAQAGRPSMVVYLDERMANLKNGKSL